MDEFLSVKKSLLKSCSEYVATRKRTVLNVMSSNKKALYSETKSSAGDKHETGRAMLQLEMEKASQQLISIHELEETLQKIHLENTVEVVCLGSLVITTMGNYFLAISVGKISFKGEDYFAVSVHSPIGRQLLGKRVGDIIPFNHAEILEYY